jgi:hypothetical protein
LLEFAAGLEYLFISVRWPVSRRGLDQHLNGCVGASFAWCSCVANRRLKLRKNPPRTFGSILTAPVVLQDIELLDDPQRNDKPHYWTPGHRGPVDLCCRNEFQQDIRIEDRWIAWRTGHAVDPYLEIVSQGLQPSGLLLDLGTNQLSRPDRLLVELANPPGATSAEHRSHRNRM